jgi:murein L,D-transpeptidase YcbB/YkuD
VTVAAGPALAAGAQGPRVASLRRRLGLRANGGRYDPTLIKAVSAFQRAHGLVATGAADAPTLAALNAGPQRYEQLIEANLERARALPPTLGERYILVNAAAGQLRLYDHGQVAKAMKVIVGKPALPTPMMAGLLSYAVFNPYWNVPADLVKDTVAPRVLREGLGYLADQGMEVLSDYGDNPQTLDPAKVDWREVASGAREVRVRQKPGPKNMMGVVKLAFPNPLGIYLHDTPMKDLFGLDQRTASSGCIRLEDARALAGLLVGEDAARAAAASGQSEKETPLPAPVPVYVTYLTAEAQGDSLVFRPDVYGRDKAWMAQQTAQLDAGEATAAGAH